jgi:hypothetical protein
MSIRLLAMQAALEPDTLTEEQVAELDQAFTDSEALDKFFKDYCPGWDDMTYAAHLKKLTDPQLRMARQHLVYMLCYAKYECNGRGIKE